jgi:hypothetical protein
MPFGLPLLIFKSGVANECEERWKRYDVDKAWLSEASGLYRQVMVGLDTVSCGKSERGDAFTMLIV